MTSKLNHSVGQRLKAARKANGLTQEELAEKVDRTKEAIFKIERGNNLPTLKTLNRMCSILAVRMQDIFKETEVDSRLVEALVGIDLMLSKMNDDDVTTIHDIIRVISQN